MSDIFVSHSSKDNEAAGEVRDWLTELGFKAVFLDFDREQGIKGGLKWERSLYTRLRRAEAVVFVCSEASVASQWCFAELALARSLNTPIVPLMKDAAVVHGLLEDTNYIDLAATDARERLRASLEAFGLDPRASFRLEPGRSPYPGLEAFGNRDAAVFFGRDPEIEELQRLLNRTLERGSPRFVTVMGPSGCGKSSLVRAGLIPRLEKMKARWLVLEPLIPGARPIKSLARLLSRALDEAGAEPRPWRELTESLLESGEELADVCHDLLQAAEGVPRSVLLFIDQFEELARAGGESGVDAEESPQSQFLRVLREALSYDDNPISVVVTVRSEFLTGFLENPLLADLMKSPMPLAPISEEGLLEVITGPAKRADLLFDPEDLPERLARETRGGDALPLLAYTLNRLYETRRTSPGSEEGGVVTAESYESLGGVVGVLSRTADRMVAELTPEIERERILRLLLRLTRLDGLEPTRERVPLESLDEEERTVARKFEEARLLKVDRGPDDKEVVEVTHEALLRNWSPLQELLAQRSDDLRLRGELKEAARQWEDAGRGEGYLLRGQRLRRALDWLEAEPSRERDLPLVAELIRESTGLNRAEREQRANVLARTVLDDHRRHPQRSILLAAAAAKELAVTPRVELALHTALKVSALRLLLPDAGSYRDAHGFSPDGSRVALSGQERGARIWDVRTGEVVLELPVQERLRYLAFAQDGRRLLTITEAGVAQSWDAESGETLTEFPVRSGKRSALFSPDGSRFACKTADSLGGEFDYLDEEGANVESTTEQPADGRLRVYDAATGELLSVLDKASPRVFSRDGLLLAALGGDYSAPTLDVWRVESGEREATLASPDSSLTWPVVACPSVDHTELLVGFSDADSALDGFRLLTVWAFDDLHKPRLVLEAAGSKACLAPGGERLMLSRKETSELWDRASGCPLHRFSHGDELYGLTCSPDGAHVLAVLAKGVAEIASADTGLSLGLAGRDIEALEVTAEPEAADFELELGDGGTVAIRNPSAGDSVAQLTGHEARVLSARLSPDARRVVTASQDGTVRVWTVDTGKVIAVLPMPNPPTGAAFAADGRSLLTTHEDGWCRRWACPTPAEMVEQAHAAVPRELTPDERADFGLRSSN